MDFSRLSERQEENGEPGQMEIKVAREAQKVRIAISGSIDEVGAQKLDSSLRSIDAKATGEVIFDFKHIDYIGSAGIGVILLFYKRLGFHGGRIAIENIPNELYTLLADEMNLRRAFSLSC